MVRHYLVHICVCLRMRVCVEGDKNIVQKHVVYFNKGAPPP